MAYRKKSWWEKVNWTVVLCLLTLSSVNYQTLVYLPKHNQEATQGHLTKKYDASSVELTVTAYTPTGSKVATLKREVVGRHAAVSRDRLDLLGKRVYVMCEDTPVGVREITDLLAEGKENTIDIMVPDKHTAKKFGTQLCKVVPLPGE